MLIEQGNYEEIVAIVFKYIDLLKERIIFGVKIPLTFRRNHREASHNLGRLEDYGRSKFPILRKGPAFGVHLIDRIVNATLLPTRLGAQRSTSPSRGRSARLEAG